jgi:hypothetical protein
MVGKCKSLIMFVTVVGISCMILNFTGIDSQVYAHGSSTAKSSECP